jgi:phosphate:Na+ symporter
VNDVEISSVILPAISGLVLFLVGMNQLIDGLKRAVGDGLKSAIQNMTRNSVKAVLTGAFITSVIQSSSITTVIAVGFITAGLLNLTQVIGIIIGANIGTTITAQMIAFDLSFLAPILLLLGFIISEFIRSEKSRHLGIVLLGLGMVFIGMEMMSHATHPLRSSQQFHDWLLQANNPLTGVLAGLIFTAIVQSSSATTGIVIVLSSQGFITLEQGISIILGSNLGTCVTALLASLGKPRIALRAASAHVIFNLLGVVLFFPFMPEGNDSHTGFVWNHAIRYPFTKAATSSDVIHSEILENERMSENMTTFSLLLGFISNGLRPVANTCRIVGCVYLPMMPK